MKTPKKYKSNENPNDIKPFADPSSLNILLTCLSGTKFISQVK